MDTSLVGQMTAQLMESLADRHDNDEATLRTVLIVCEVDYPDSTTLQISASDDRPWVQQAFVEEVATYMERRREELERDRTEQDDD